MDSSMLKVHLQTFLAIPMIQKCQILSCDTLGANERYQGSQNYSNFKLELLRAHFSQKGKTCGVTYLRITPYLPLYYLI